MIILQTIVLGIVEDATEFFNFFILATRDKIALVISLILKEGCAEW